MSTKGKYHNKRWLISKLKTSGSKRERVISADYSDTRNSKQSRYLEDLPQHQSIGRSSHFYNGKINTDLLLRFLRSNAGKEWKTVYEEILARIPSNLSEYRHCIYWYVADSLESHGGKLWDKRSQKYLSSPQDDFLVTHHPKEFYVDPETGVLLETVPVHPETQ